VTDSSGVEWWESILGKKVVVPDREEEGVRDKNERERVTWMTG